MTSEEIVIVMITTANERKKMAYTTICRSNLVNILESAWANKHWPDFFAENKLQIGYSGNSNKEEKSDG